MKSLLNQLHRLGDDELMLISQAIDAELLRREEIAEQFSASVAKRSFSSDYLDDGESQDIDIQRRRHAA